MAKSTTPKLTVALLLLLLTASTGRALQSNAGLTSTPPAPPPTSTSSAPNGVTGTDPEPIDPDIVGLILSILHLS